MLGNRRWLTLERDNADDACAFQDGEPFADVEPREAIAGKQRPINLLLAILPAAPACDGRQKSLDMLLRQLLAHHLFVTRSGPQGIPANLLTGRARHLAAYRLNRRVALH